jgi:hypothetical protein
MGINTPKPNRIDQTASDQKLIDGFSKHATVIPSMMINGAVVLDKDIVGTLQSRIDSAKMTLSTRATWQTAVQADRTLRETTKTLVSAVKQGLLVAFASQLDTLADFGLTARAKPVRTPGEKLAAAARAKATRAARHTLGSKQKAAIKGAVSPTEPVNPAPSAPTPAPTSPATPQPTPVLTTSPAQPVASPVAATPSPVSPAPTQLPSHSA